MIKLSWPKTPADPMLGTSNGACGCACLTHWGRVTHICVSNQTIIGSNNGLSPGRRQAIIWTNAGILLIGPLGTNFSEILIKIHIFSFKKMHLKMSCGIWRPFCLGLDVFVNHCRIACHIAISIIVSYKNVLPCRVRTWIENELIELINSDQFDFQFQLKIIEFQFNSCWIELNWLSIPIQFMNWSEPWPQG